jgi:hypothetical protein
VSSESHDELPAVLSLIFAILVAGGLGLYAFQWSAGAPPRQVILLGTPTHTLTATATYTLRPTFTATVTTTRTPTATHTTTATPTNAPTLTSTPSPTSTVTQTPTPSRTATPAPPATASPTGRPAAAVSAPQAASAPAHTDIPRLALASYFAWYDLAGWNACNISGGDRPAQVYGSDDPAAIARHVQLALSAGIDGFTLNWFAPGERTDNNFNTLLAQSAGAVFGSTVIFQRHNWPGSPAPNQQNIAEAVRYILDRYSSHPNFLKVNGRPVLFFTDLPRVPSGSPVQFWAAVRQQADPNHTALWIGEGLDFSYLSVFDGQYVFKVTHAAYPQDYAKSSRWAGQVRAWENTAGQAKLWVATLHPGWDDLRAGCRPDIRAPSQPTKADRGDGAFMRANFEAAQASSPDWLWIHSFNEWVEGTYIEPSAQYGDRYLNLARDLIQQFKATR